MSSIPSLYCCLYYIFSLLCEKVIALILIYPSSFARVATFRFNFADALSV
jgi:hypothetical protein